MEFSVEPEVFVRFPGMRLAVVVAHDVDNRADRPVVDEAWSRAWAGAATAVTRNAQSHPRVRAWRQRFQATGISMRQFPTSIEALLRRAMKGRPGVLTPSSPARHGKPRPGAPANARPGRCSDSRNSNRSGGRGAIAAR
jgi:hypothetical protein